MDRRQQIYDTKCLHYIDWLVETRPSFSPPRRDLRPPGMDPGANEVYTERLDALNTKFQRLLEQLSQRLKTAIEVSGADGLVSISIFYIFKYLILSNMYSNWSIFAISLGSNSNSSWRSKLCSIFSVKYALCTETILSFPKWMKCRKRYRRCPRRITRKLVFVLFSWIRAFQLVVRCVIAIASNFATVKYVLVHARFRAFESVREVC